MLFLLRILIFLVSAAASALVALPFLREVVLPADLRQDLENGPYARFLGGDAVLTFGAAGALLSVAVLVLLSSWNAPRRSSRKLGPSVRPGQKPTRRVAKALMKARRFHEAADMYKELGDVPQLVEALKGALRFSEAADLLESEGRHTESAQLLENSTDPLMLLRAGDVWTALDQVERARVTLTKAAALFGGRGDPERALELYLRVGDAKAAEVFLLPAAEHLAHKGRHQDAARLLESFGRFAQAGAAYEYAASLLPVDQRRPVLTQAAVAFKNAGDWSGCGRALEGAAYPEQAADAYMRAEQWPQAARAWTQAGKPDVAARLLLEKGLGAQAVAYFESVGDTQAAAHAALASGDPSKAAHLFEENGDLDNAFAAHLKAGNHGAAADIALQRNRVAEAAELLERGGVFKRAGEMFERLGNRLKAGEMYAKAGDDAGAARMLLLEGRLNEAAALLRGSGKPELADVQVDLARRMAATGDRAGAAAFLRSAVDARSAAESVAMALELSGLLEAVGEVPVALAYAQRAAQARPDHAEAVMRVQQLFMQVSNMHMRAAYEAAMKQQLAAQAALATQRRMVLAPAAGSGAQDPPRYLEEGQLGRGAMGVVFKARDTLLNRLVALKRLPESLATDPQARARFLEEARAAARLNHPYVVTVYDAGIEAGSPYLAMEMVEGTTLASMLNQKVAVGVALQWCAAIAAALDHAHQAGIVHRDVKPGNILMGRDGRVKLTDFGIAAVLSSNSAGVTGTPYYMSPEQVMGQAVDGRADLYALGCVLFAVLTGAPPFGGQDVLQKHLHQAPPLVSSVRPDAPPELDALVGTLLAKDPAKRLQTGADVAKALMALDQRIKASRGRA